MNSKIFACILFLVISFLYVYNHSNSSKVEFNGNAMTIDYRVIIGHPLLQNEKNQIEDIVNQTFKEIDDVYNKWNPESEISKINQSKKGVIIPLSEKLEKFLYLTDSVVKLTKGRFDPTIEPLQQLWKTHLQRGEIPSEQKVQEILPAVGWKKIHYGNGTFYKDHDKTSLDLGGIAKGYCVDLLLENLVNAGFKNVFVEWGGEIRVSGKHPDDRPWSVFITGLYDVDPNNALAYINLDNQAVATSGDYLQNWKIEKDGVETIYFHIIDPITGSPLIAASNVASATVVADTCVLADALATVALMHPSLEAAQQWADEISKDNKDIKFWLYSRLQTEKLH